MHLSAHRTPSPSAAAAAPAEHSAQGGASTTLALAVTSAALPFLSYVGWARADAGSVASQMTTVATSAEVDAVAAALNPDAVTQQLIIGALFYTVLALLAVVTLGVAYIVLGGWLDQRTDGEDRKKADDPEAAGPTPAGRKKDGAEFAIKRAREAKREKKGFGNFEE